MNIKSNNLLSSILFLVALFSGFICSFCAFETGLKEWWPLLIFAVLNIPVCGFAAFELFEKLRGSK